jgi:hypothetical protein
MTADTLALYESNSKLGLGPSSSGSRGGSSAEGMVSLVSTFQLPDTELFFLITWRKLTAGVVMVGGTNVADVDDEGPSEEYAGGSSFSYEMSATRTHRAFKKKSLHWDMDDSLL